MREIIPALVPPKELTSKEYTCKSAVGLTWISIY